MRDVFSFTLFSTTVVLACGCSGAPTAPGPLIKQSVSAQGERIATIGSWEPTVVVRARAGLDFDCPSDQVRFTEVARLEGAGSLHIFYAVSACGHDARYGCIDTTATTYCVREPLDEQRPR